jgi:DNA-directed RNA polymerase subunit N (RpoN/RPB10)
MFSIVVGFNDVLFLVTTLPASENNLSAATDEARHSHEYSTFDIRFESIRFFRIRIVVAFDSTRFFRIRIVLRFDSIRHLFDIYSTRFDNYSILITSNRIKIESNRVSIRLMSNRKNRIEYEWDSYSIRFDSWESLDEACIKRYCCARIDRSLYPLVCFAHQLRGSSQYLSTRSKETIEYALYRVEFLMDRIRPDLNSIRIRSDNPLGSKNSIRIRRIALVGLETPRWIRGLKWIRGSNINPFGSDHGSTDTGWNL